MMIIKLWLWEEKNVKEISDKLKDLYSLDSLIDKFIYILSKL